ncbi:unnamed protein product [Arctia plantaginis]|uniref:Uncharacterized protein n=1 Tax=Arctia plantaginis TaxID=874455 RepID=A0A8S1AN56_ARCPL|nr:unnamed protein product [Arctia plantaginis]CAB3248259.1 unnamed protein product [Arctia plantaginis]
MRAGTIQRMRVEYPKTPNPECRKAEWSPPLGDISECDSIYPRFLLESGVTRQIGNCVTVNPKKENMMAFCSVPEHREQGVRKVSGQRLVKCRLLPCGHDFKL